MIWLLIGGLAAIVLLYGVFACLDVASRCDDDAGYY